MITTVTTTTTASLSTGASIALVALVTLIVLLVNKEIVLTSEAAWAKRLGTALNVGIVPLLMAFAATALMRLASLLA